MARGDGAIYFDHRGAEHKPGSGKGRDADNTMFHKGCKGRWVGEIWSGGKKVGKVSAQTKGDCQAKVKTKRDEIEHGVVTSASYTVEMALEDWLAKGMEGRDQSTISNARYVMKRLMLVKVGSGTFGTRPLSKLTGVEAQDALREFARTRSYSTVQRAHVCLRRCITFAKLYGRVTQNVAELFETPRGGNDGRPSKSLTLRQVTGILVTARGKRNMDLYVHLSIMHGDRTEELRALPLENMDDEGYDILTSVRKRGRLKTETSKRGHVMAVLAREALDRHLAIQAQDRAYAGELWTGTGLVFVDERGRGPFTDQQIRRMLRELLAEVPAEYGISPDDWTPRELRHTFASLMHDYGAAAVEVIAAEMGHNRTSTTRGVYIKQLRPRRTDGAAAMDRVLKLVEEDAS